MKLNFSMQLTKKTNILQSLSLFVNTNWNKEFPDLTPTGKKSIICVSLINSGISHADQTITFLADLAGTKNPKNLYLSFQKTICSTASHTYMLQSPLQLFLQIIIYLIPPISFLYEHSDNNLISPSTEKAPDYLLQTATFLFHPALWLNLNPSSSSACSKYVTTEPLLVVLWEVLFLLELCFTYIISNPIRSTLINTPTQKSNMTVFPP